MLVKSIAVEMINEYGEQKQYVNKGLDHALKIGQLNLSAPKLVQSWKTKKRVI